MRFIILVVLKNITSFYFKRFVNSQDNFLIYLLEKLEPYSTHELIIFIDQTIFVDNVHNIKF